MILHYFISPDRQAHLSGVPALDAQNLTGIHNVVRIKRLF